MIRSRVRMAAAVLAVLSAACADDGPIEPAQDEASVVETPTTPRPTLPAELDVPAWFAGGAGSTGEIAFVQPIAGLTEEQLAQFEAGVELLERLFRPESGLGPDFSADGCTACHANNGRQGAALLNGYLGIGPVVHVSAPGAGSDEVPFALPGYGTRLQTYSLQGDPEAQINLFWETVTGTYPDGSTYELRKPVTSVIGREGMLPADAEISLRIPPQLAGPGLLDQIDSADIVAAADPEDLDGDGVSGRVQWVPTSDGTSLVGRHGWKAEAIDLARQSARALADDMGIGTTLIPVDGSVELTNDELADLVFALTVLAPPSGRHLADPNIASGAAQFQSVGCSSCHTPEQRTSSDTAALDGLLILPFSDLLLHDLGPGLADDRPVLQATGSEWRTAPLWGVGALPLVNGHVSLLHDGRARSVEEAILWHGGEADAAVAAFMALPGDLREQLIQFVESR